MIKLMASTLAVSLLAISIAPVNAKPFKHKFNEWREYNSAWLAVCPVKLEPEKAQYGTCLLYTSPSPRDKRQSRMPSSA